ncbi:MAG: glucose 1-dehydrogenase [Clostridium sp.]|jgi:3-oxoacyl-[acyl-carrier protein] reductase|nr:glucose 1-dehydrogenase [Clostridium sp.]
MKRLDGKVAIITGSTSGMGRDTAYLFAKEGAKVVVTGRNEERAKEVVETIRKDGGTASYVLVDMANLDEVRKIYNHCIDEYGTVDILFNNAGLLSLATIMDISLEEWEKMYTVNVTAPVLLAKLCAPLMKEKGHGVILNTGSIAGTSARWGKVAYCSTKHALNGVTVALARELGPEIRVNAILPGAIETAMLDGVGGVAAMAPMAQMSSLKRTGKGEEIATTALFLCTDDSSFITGQLIRVDGGLDA